MHFHILGVGSIGCLVAHHLRRVLPVAHSISLIHKTHVDRSKFLKRGCISVEHKGVVEKATGFHHEVFYEDSPRPDPALEPPLESETLTKGPSDKPITSLFVTLKSHQTIHAISALAPRLTPSSTIVLLQNGMGVFERLLDNVFPNPSQRPHFILGTNTHGAFSTDAYKVVHAGLGTIDLGIAPDHLHRDFEAGLFDDSITPSERRLKLSDLSPPNDPEATHYGSLNSTMAALLLLQSLETSWKPYFDIQVLLRRKLAVNAVINPLTAILDCRNGDLFDHTPARALMIQICNEASAVFRAQMDSETALWMSELKAQGVDTKGHQKPDFPVALSSEALQNEVLYVASITRRNISSTLQDVRKGRHTEIMHINGYLTHLGRRFKVPTPVNQTIADLVHMKYLLPANVV